MATRSMTKELDENDSRAVSTTILRLFEGKSVEDPWVEVLSADELLGRLGPRVSSLKTKVEHLTARLETIDSLPPLYQAAPITPERTHSRSESPHDQVISGRTTDECQPPGSFFPAGEDIPSIHLHLNVTSLSAPRPGELSQVSRTLEKDDLTVNCSEVVDLLEEIRSDKRMAEELCGSVLPRPQRSSTLRASRGSTSAVWAVCLFVALLGVPLYVDRFLA